MSKILQLFSFAVKSKVHIVVSLLILGAIGYGGYKIFLAKPPAPTYQTAQAEKGTLITSVTGSGNISAGSSVDITTQASGVVSKVYVQNGDTVTQGQKIADLTLDQNSQQKQQAAWASYLSAKSQLDSAQNNLNTLQNTEFTANQKFINDAVARGLTTTDPTYIEENASWLAAEASYKNQQTVIAQAQAALSSATLSYQQISPTITAPANGTITNLILTPGLPVTTTTTTSNNSSSTSSSTLGTITVNQGQVQAVVNLSEIDVVKVTPGMRATLTLDALPDKTFTGSVLSINTNGVVSSGVTTYPTIISLDTIVNNVYPNMAVTAKIITNTKTNVVLVPSSAVQNSNGQTVVRELKNNQLTQVPVQVGDANDTQTEIVSGVNEGDTIVTGVTATGASSSTSTTSPFGATRGFGGFGGGGARGGRGG